MSFLSFVAEGHLKNEGLITRKGTQKQKKKKKRKRKGQIKDIYLFVEVK